MKTYDLNYYHDVSDIENYINEKAQEGFTLDKFSTTERNGDLWFTAVMVKEEPDPNDALLAAAKEMCDVLRGEHRAGWLEAAHHELAEAVAAVEKGAGR